MKTLKVNISEDRSFEEAQSEVKKVVGRIGAEWNLVSWYDRKRRTGGPLEACENEGINCSSDYAMSHCAELRIAVNGGDYVFYFAKVPKSFAELNPSEVARNHRGLKNSVEFDNQQGG